MGRKKVLWICYIIGTFGITVAAFSKNWTEFQIALITAGSGISPYITLTFVLLNEISGSEFNAISTMMFQLAWGIGQFIFVFIALSVPNWKDQILFFIAIPLMS